MGRKFTERLNSKFKIPVHATDDIVNEVQEFFGRKCIKALKEKAVRTILGANLVNTATSVQSLMADSQQAADLFKDLQASYQQVKYFNKSGCYIEPESLSI